MHKTVTRFIPFIVVFAALSGCATIIQGTSQKVPVMSNPPGAIVYMNGQQMGVTPMTLDIPRKDDSIIAFTKDGYQTQTSMVTSVVSGWFAGNILFGGIVGGVVDLASGAAYRLVPENISVQLTGLGPNEKASAPPLSIAKLSPQDKLKRIDALHAAGLITEDEYKAQKKLLDDEIAKGASATS